MAEKDRSAKDVGSKSPPSESAKEQRMSGSKGGAQASGGSAGQDKQPPQTSGRRDPAHEHDGTVRKGYDAAQDPERQGDGDPGPEQIRDSSSMQGAAGGAGGGMGQGSRKQESAQSGDPQDGHTRSGRQKAPGDRNPQQPD
jgi:hypothetical protein